MRKALQQFLIEKINTSEWWHVQPRDSQAYEKRGKFLASTYSQAAFYGRPNDDPETVSINDPLFGFSEMSILRRLFPRNYRTLLKNVEKDDDTWYSRRIGLDAKIYRQGRSLGYDAIVLLAYNSMRYLTKHRKPHSMELNLLRVS